MLVAAKPYASESETAHGWLLAHVKAVPPSQPDLVSGPSTCWLELHVRTGEETEALPDQPHEGLQQSLEQCQYQEPSYAFQNPYQ